jgi:hypothetical protein
MTTFAYNESVTDAIKDTISVALGASSSATFGNNDLGKAVKRGTAQNYVLCTDNDPIEGFAVAIEPFTVNDGFSFGSVQRRGRMTVQVGTGETVTLNGFVVAYTQTALGTAGYAQVAPAVATAATDDGSLTTAGLFAWQVVRIVSGTGVAGDLVLIERV